jgi:hypothetical protein
MILDWKKLNLALTAKKTAVIDNDSPAPNYNII